MKRIISLLLSAGMIFQCITIYAADKITDSQVSSDDYLISLNEYVEKQRKYIPVYPKENDIVIDGDISDWDKYAEIEAKRIKSYIDSNKTQHFI